MRTALQPYAKTGAALATAGAIALSLVGPPPAPSDMRVPAVYSSTAGVELTASAGSFVNPITRWADVLGTTNASLSTLVDKAAADPMPVLRQIIANQTAYASTIGTSLTRTSTGLVQWLTSEQGTGIGTTLPASLPVIIERLSQGDIVGAQTEFASALSGLATTLFTMLDLLSLPYQISANVTAALNTIVQKSMFDTGLVGRTGFGLLATVQMAVQQLAESAQAVVDAGEAGDPVAALSAIVNAPADLTDVVVNGKVNRFGKRIGGLLTFTPATSSGWGLGSALLVHIPQAIADAITPPAPAPAPAPTAADVASLPSAAAKTLALDVSSPREKADLKSAQAATEITSTEPSLVRESPVVRRGKVESGVAHTERTNLHKGVSDGIKSTVKKLRVDLRKTAAGPGAKRKSANGSRARTSGDSKSHSEG
ncbi:hypothetical protein [Mycolicibacterium lutetiense]|uniref:PE-PGRS family protein n=1 Tax=Mycolicibacterium lutetiense TaxID=1641992 RepID=A0ABS4ZYX5_9MYCO|nr:hypothetical protein [Mycolicibacterium lutetiense]MBP2454630.1 hypothetical protein [Mycolicibacterium lutetiense]